MKRILLSVLTVVSLLSCASCHKSSVNRFSGTYSFKTSGKIVITTPNENRTISLPEQIGTMHIVKNSTANSGDVLITMNEIGGDIYTMYADIDGKELNIKSYEKTLDLKLVDIVGGDFTVKFNGTGTLNDDVLILKQTCRGAKDTLGISSEEILTVAVLNE